MDSKQSARWWSRIKLGWCGRRQMILCMALCGALWGCAGLSHKPPAAGFKARQAFEQGQDAEAAAALKPLAEAGDPEAQYALGYLYHTGRGVAHSERQARWWIRQAAMQGHARARAALRLLHAHDGFWAHGLQQQSAPSS